MSSFFKETIKARLYANKDKYLLLKLNDLLDWQRIGNQLRQARQLTRPDSRGNQGYDSLKMFKAILLGQWHSLSDPELEHALTVRADFLVFCDFDDMELPDHSTLCRYRQWLIKNNILEALLREINAQLEAQNLKINQAQMAIVDASIIESAGRPKRKALTVNEDDSVNADEISKDSDARWVKKGGRFFLGYKLHARCDEEGYFEALHVTPANAHESQHFEPLLDDLAAETEVLADKGYASKANRGLLEDKALVDGIMHKAVRGRSLSEAEKQRNQVIKKSRWVIEQSFGTLKRGFNFVKSSYFGTENVRGQSILKGICSNLLKACNKVSYV